MDQQQENVLRTVEEQHVGFVRLWFSDVLGNLKSVTMTEAELPSAFEEGIGFDGSAIDGFARIQESDMVVFPDASTFRTLPWKQAQPGVGRMFCDIMTPEGEPFGACPRNVLKRTLTKAADMGFSCYMHPEIEYYLLNSVEDPTPIDRGSYFDTVPNERQSEFRRDAMRYLEDMGIPVEYSHHEVGPGQHEMDLRYAEALTTADNIMTFRHVIKQVAMRHGIHATFMPKPLSGEFGNGMHTHMSLFDGDTNAFYDATDPLQLSETARQFIAGLLYHAREITAVTNQWVNSYKRLIPGYEAPVDVSWGRYNRADLIRIPRYKPNKSSSVRLEYRAPDPAANPYLAFSLMIAAGLKGIEEGYELPAESLDSAYSLTNAQRKALGVAQLPLSLADALGCMEESELVAETLGEHVFRYFLRNKWEEWEQYRQVITAYELDHYLPIL